MMPCLGGGRGGRQEEEQGSGDEDAEWCTETSRAGSLMARRDKGGGGIREDALGPWGRGAYGRRARMEMRWVANEHAEDTEERGRRASGRREKSGLIF